MRVAVQTQKADAESSLRVANAEARISALEQKERTGVDPGGCGSAEEDVNVEVQRLEHQEAAANEIASHKNTHSAPLQEIEETKKRPGLHSNCSSARHGSGQGNPWHSDGTERAEVPHERHASSIPSTQHSRRVSDGTSMKWCQGMGVWEPACPSLRPDAEGAKAVSLRWIDTNEGDAGRPNTRSRLIVGEREVKKAMKRSDVPSAAELFSGMPPLESGRALLSLFVSHSQEEAKGKRTLAMYDISGTHFHGVPVRRVFVELRTRRKKGSHVKMDPIKNSLAS